MRRLYRYFQAMSGCYFRSALSIYCQKMSVDTIPCETALTMAPRSATVFLLCFCALLASAVEGIATNCSCDGAALPSVDSLGLPPPLTEGHGIAELQCSLRCNEVSAGTSINVSECKSACTDAFSKAGDCIRVCDASSSCTSGCNVYAQLSSTATESVAGIDAPSSAPVLALQEDLHGRPAEYSVEVPGLFTSSPVNTSLGFLFRINNPTHNTTVYIPLVATVENLTLSLAAFLCQKVNVSYAVLSRRFLSDYSPPTTLCIPGVPGPPRNIDVLVQEDTRPGYSEINAVLNITWERPESFDYLSHFSLAISSIDSTSTVNLKCRLNQHLSIININKNSTGILIQSEDIGQLLVFCCRYQIALTSHPSIRESGAVTKVFQASYTFEIHCEAHYSAQSGTYTLRAEWHLDLPAAVVEAISRFEVEVEVSTAFLYSFPTVSRRRCNGSFCAVSGLSPSERDYLLRVTPIKKPGFPRRQFIGPDACTLPAPPVLRAPSRMDSVLVEQHKFNLDDKLLDVTVRWTQPEYFNGKLLGYELRVAKEPIYDVDDGSYTATNLAYVLDDIKPTSTSFRVRIAIFWYEPETLNNTVHFQMRARNEFDFSDWSDPTQIQLPTMMANSNAHIYIIAGLVMMSSTVLALVLIFVLICVCSKCKRQRKITVRSTGRERASNIYHYVEPFVAALQSHNASSFSQQLAETDPWEIKPGTVKIFTDQQLQGYFGKTYKGSVESDNGLQHEALSVAVKKLEDHATVEDNKDFLHEIDIMKEVSGSTDVRKSFVVNMVGCITVQRPLLLILEYTHQSDLLSYVRENRRQEQAACSTNKEGTLSRPRTPVVFEVGEMERRDLWRFAWQIAAGMDFLSSLGIVHGNLACRNILVGEGKNIKVSNFVMPTQSGRNVIDSKSLRWMALESMLHSKFTTSSDVWSYGVVLWELSTMGAFPYPTVSDEKLAPLLKAKFRLEKPEHSTSAMYELMEQCWDEDPQNRPSFSELCKKFEHMLSSCIENEQLHVSTAEFVTG